MSFFKALAYDLIGQDDKAHAIIGVSGKDKEKYRKNVMLLCVTAAVLLGVLLFPYGLIGSALLVAVAARKFQLIKEDE